MSNKTNITNSDQSNVSSNEDGTMSKYSDYQRSSASFNSSEMSRDTNKNREGSSGIGTSISSNSNRNSIHSHLHQFDCSNNYSLNQSQATKAQKVFVKRVELLDELKSLINLQHCENNASIKQKNQNQATTTTITTTTTTTTTTIKTKPSEPSNTTQTSNTENKDDLNINTNNNNLAHKSIKISCNSSLAADNEGHSKLSSSMSTTTKKQTVTSAPRQPNQTEYDIDNIVISAIQYIKNLQKNQHKNSINEENDQTSNRNNSTNNNNNNNILSLSPTSNASSSSSNINKIELIPKINKIEDMCISILVKSGMIVYANEKLTNLLGYPANSWLGKRPIDFLYKNDSNLLLTKLCDLTYKINNSCFEKTVSDIEIEPFYLRFKKQKNECISQTQPEEIVSETTLVNSAVGQTSNDMPLLVFKHNSKEYLAFKIELKADKVEINNKNVSEKPLETDSSSSMATFSSTNNELLLTTLNKDKLTDVSGDSNNKFNTSLNSDKKYETSIIFKFIYPQIAYLQELDNFTERSFISQHDINLRILRIDNTVTELLGFLPQDLEKKSFLKFIHPDDLDKIKKVHYDIYDGNERQNQEIYRWRCFNGSYVSVKTNWSWFIHPWKKQIDFIIGKHLVLNEPLNKNIFEESHKHFDSKNKELRIESCTVTSKNDSINLHPTEITNLENSEKLKKTEKDIIDYISKKIPGMDDATQILGEDVIRLIKKKNISASYCQQQNILIKHRQKQFNDNKSYQFTPSKQIYQYPQYFQPAKYFQHKLKDPKLANLIKFPNQDLTKRNYHLLSTKHDNMTIESSSKQTKSNKHSSDKIKLDQNITSSSVAGTSTTPAVTLDTKVNLEKKQLYLTSDESVSKLNTSPTLIQQPMPQNQQRLPDQQLLSKKAIELSILKEKGFFQHYTICKYLESLPNIWKPTNFNKKDNIKLMSDDVAAVAANVCLDLDEPMTSEVAATTGSTKKNETIISNLNENLIKQPVDRNHTQNSPNNAINMKTSFKRPLENTNTLTDQDSTNYVVTMDVSMIPQNEIIFKKGSSYSSKSHSKIVLIDENDNDEEEESGNLKSNELTPNKDNNTVSPNSNKNNFSTLANNTINNGNTSPVQAVVSCFSQVNTKEPINSAITSLIYQNKDMQSSSGIYSGDLNNIHSVSSQNFNNINYNKNNNNNKQQQSLFNQQYQFDSASNQFSNNSTSNSSNNISNNNKPSENYYKLTKENLNRFTREQDELYTLSILRKVQRPIKIFSESPQNICAQAPNVFSRNEYEPPLKRKKPLTFGGTGPDQNLKDRIKKTLETSSGSVMDSNDIIDSYNTTDTGPYNVVVHNEQMDCDNPQKYHEIFHKKVDQDIKNKQSSIIMSNETDHQKLKINQLSKINESLKNNNKINIEQSNSNNSNSNYSNENAFVVRDSIENLNKSSSGGGSTDEDIINFWKKCMRHGSAITKRLKECENLLKLIGNLTKNESTNIVNLNSNHIVDITNSKNNISNQTFTNLVRYKRELKKRLYIIAGLLGINLDIVSTSGGKNNTSGEDNSTSSGADETNKSSDLLDQYIKKIHNELVQAVNDYTTQSITSSSTSSKQIITSQSDPNSLDLLTSIYEDLKMKFISQFHKFNQQKPPFNHSSSSLLRSSATENCDEELNNIIINPSNNNRMHKNHNSPGGSRSNHSPNDYEFLSNNEFDDSSTYLFDSPTTSFETNSSNGKEKTNKNKNLELSNNKSSSNLLLNSSSSNIEKNSNQITTSQINLTNNSETKSSTQVEKTKNSSATSSNTSGDHHFDKPSTYDEYFEKTNMFHLSSEPIYTQKISDNSANLDSDETNNPNQNPNNSYDDRLCVKLMQNYIDLFKSNKNQSQLIKNDFSKESTQSSLLANIMTDETSSIEHLYIEPKSYENIRNESNFNDDSNKNISSSEFNNNNNNNNNDQK